jgi:2-polyprenyl-3-methyl-5-hydroxy-6-metoxy-1,4-benzoquinol methylase
VTGDARVGQAQDPNDWDHHWDAYGEAAERSPANEYRRALILKLLGRPPAGSTVLDIGSGQGQLTLALQEMYPDLAVRGVEYSAEGVARSREHAAQRGSAAEFRQMDLLQPTALADGQPLAAYAVCTEVLEHVDDPVTLIRNARALLAPGCHLVVTVPGGPRSAFEHHIGHFQHFTARKLRQVLTDAGYEVQRVQRAGFPFFNLYKLAVIARGKKLIADVEHRAPGEAMPAESIVKAFFGFGMRHNLDNSPLGWQMAAVAIVPTKDRS